MKYSVLVRVGVRRDARDDEEDDDGDVAGRE